MGLTFPFWGGEAIKSLHVGHGLILVHRLGLALHC